ncbi:MAG: glycosyltransferase family 4 protein [Desulfobacteraceae bacterium]|uniref:Glycosyltransferase family 4 protein n=1 Tax=Candidatus Desulfaltia bathyphila TaxID=2841697 RepID=A0A8J6N2T4_9BACT|nr:glycosyltransferase family 4 protein [Candidatus Desulfaltia bathyphila]MBL7196197.1 glycosyltransferase family 4 protein [Desulfobacterales bacterium]
MKKTDSVLIITERFHPEEFGINDLAQAWQAKGYEVAVLTQTPSYPFDKVYEGYRNKLFQAEKWKGIKIYRVLSLMGYKKGVILKVLNYLCFAFFASLVAMFTGRKYNSVFVYHIGPLTQTIPAILIKKIFGNKFYIWTLDIWPDSVYAYGFKKRALYEKLLDSFVRAAYKNCETVFVSCKGFKRKIQKYVPDIKIIFSPQWAPDDLVFDNVIPHESLKEGFNFTFAGNIGKVQNLENVIRGFALVMESRNRIRLNIIGDGSNLETLKDIVKEEKIANVYFWGRKPLKEMPRWFEGSDVLIISLIDEPIFSLTVPAKFQAYLASNKPIYCVMKGEVADLVTNNKVGFVAQPNNIDNIKAGFENFLNTPPKELKLFENNMKSLLCNEFDRNKIIQQMTEEIFPLPISAQG